jgi:hypothetical protein
MLKKSFILLALAISTLAMTGCFDSDVDEQSVPWGRPADWERGAPGFGG